MSRASGRCVLSGLTSGGELHFVCKMRVETPETPGEKTTGVDLGICNTAAVSVGDETLLYPGNALNAAENMRATVTPNPARDRSNGCLAQPSVRLSDKSTGRMRPRERAVSRTIIFQCGNPRASARGERQARSGGLTGGRTGENGRHGQVVGGRGGGRRGLWSSPATPRRSATATPDTGDGVGQRAILRRATFTLRGL